jgi:hypothetical protein
MLTKGNPFHGQWNPGQGSVPMPIELTGGNPFQKLWNTTLREIPSHPSMSYYKIQLMTSQQVQYLNAGHGVYQNLGQQTKYSWKPGANQISGSFSLVHTQNPKLPFLVMLHFPDLSILLNGPICHNQRWPPMSTNFPSNILKFEGNPNEYLGDNVTTFHL